MLRILCFLSVLIMAFAGNALSETLYVPAGFPDIQSAIDSSGDFDTIIVSEGTYVENLNFRGKKILLASLYLVDGETVHILNTVIDGSQPSSEDTGSCVLFVSGEDSNSVIQGFTITQGTGTKWTDEHGHGVFIEGGGILISFASPKILNNVIVYNEAIRTASGIVSSGAGGIRVGDGFPLIQNNVIIGNSGMYGGGIVLNYSGGIIRNNIIAKNRVYRPFSQHNTYGGGGIWIGNDNPSYPRTVENNVITGNSALGDGSLPPCGKGGGILIHSTSVEVRNNIICGNTATYSSYNQIWTYSAGTTAFTYCDIEDGWSGTGNISADPLFCDSNYVLSQLSPCVDSGDPSSSEDPEDSLNPGHALYPSRGLLRNDIGTYGGQFAKIFPDITSFSFVEEKSESNFDWSCNACFLPPLYGRNEIGLRFFLPKESFIEINIFNVTGAFVKRLVQGFFISGIHEFVWDRKDSRFLEVSSGVFFIKLNTDETESVQKLCLLI
ncbi:hypothetical protein JXL83_06260 [candidate division WOR-3 bacterium]|nr:hypothetical protein [candidate division WOR-3 bacterium]